MDYTKKQSDSFEDELDEFFKERALFRAQALSDSSRTQSGSARNCDDKVFENPNSSTGLSGCCMTGCVDCPWGYTPPLN
jgi:hypothetical protein